MEGFYPELSQLLNSIRKSVLGEHKQLLFSRTIEVLHRYQLPLYPRKKICGLEV